MRQTKSATAWGRYAAQAPIDTPLAFRDILEACRAIHPAISEGALFSYLREAIKSGKVARGSKNTYKFIRPTAARAEAKPLPMDIPASLTDEATRLILQELAALRLEVTAIRSKLGA